MDQVLYIGRIKVSHRKGPPSFVDDALEELRKHELEKLHKNEKQQEKAKTPERTTEQQRKSQSVLSQQMKQSSESSTPKSISNLPCIDVGTEHEKSPSLSPVTTKPPVSPTWNTSIKDKSHDTQKKIHFSDQEPQVFTDPVDIPSKPRASTFSGVEVNVIGATPDKNMGSLPTQVNRQFGLSIDIYP